MSSIALAKLLQTCQPATSKSPCQPGIETRLGLAGRLGIARTPTRAARLLTHA